MAKRRKVNLSPFDLRLKKNRGGFFMTIMGGTKSGNEYEIELDFEDWWVKHFHEKFSSLLDEKYNDALALRRIFTNNEPPF